MTTGPMTRIGADTDRFDALFAVLTAVVVFVVGMVSGCGGANYGEDNAALAQPLLANTSVITALGSEETEYCASGSCTLGSNGMVTTYAVTISGEFDRLVAAFRAAYPGFAVGSELCDDPTCVDKYVVWATRATSSIELAYDDNMSGRLTVDAHTAAVPTNSTTNPTPVP